MSSNFPGRARLNSCNDGRLLDWMNGCTRKVCSHGVLVACTRVRADKRGASAGLHLHWAQDHCLVPSCACLTNACLHAKLPAVEEAFLPLGLFLDPRKRPGRIVCSPPHQQACLNRPQTCRHMQLKRRSNHTSRPTGSNFETPAVNVYARSRRPTIETDAADFADHKTFGL